MQLLPVPTMDRVIAVAVVLFACCSVFGVPQGGRKPATDDPVRDFFNPKCNAGRDDCVLDSECTESDRIPGEKCGNHFLVCCRSPSDFVFPTRVTRKPPTVATTPTTTTTTTRTTPRPTTRTTTKTTTTTTTEEPDYTEYVVPDCGRSDSDFTPSGVDIRDAEKGEFPWNVGIFTMDDSFGFNQSIFHCGGTLIDDFVVITSANCVSRKGGKDLYVFAGLLKLEDDEERRQIKKVKQVIRHPGYQSPSKAPNFAFLVLEDKVDFSPTVNRICLPDLDIQEAQFEECYLTGWGVVPNENTDDSSSVRSTMKVLEMKVEERKTCQKKMKSILPQFKLHESLMCAKESSSNHICPPEDDGSPLVCKVPGQERQYYHVGVFSWNRYMVDNVKCREEPVLNHFTKIQTVRKWIDEQMEIQQRPVNIYLPQPSEDNED